VLIFLSLQPSWGSVNSSPAQYTPGANNLLYRMYSHLYTMAELRQIVLSHPFDRSEKPRQIKLVDPADWLEALVTS
jgi:hypothetical protein